MFLRRVFTGFDSKSGLEFLILDCKDDKGHRVDDTKEVQYLYKTFFVKHTAQEQIRNAEIIARTQDIQDV